MHGEERDDARCGASGEARDEARRGERPPSVGWTGLPDGAIE